MRSPPGSAVPSTHKSRSKPTTASSGGRHGSFRAFYDDQKCIPDRTLPYRSCGTNTCHLLRTPCMERRPQRRCTNGAASEPHQGLEKTKKIEAWATFLGTCLECYAYRNAVTASSDFSGRLREVERSIGVSHVTFWDVNNLTACRVVSGCKAIW